MTETPAEPVPGERVSGWGYSFTWTADHLPREKIDPLRQEYDTLGAAAVERLQAIRATAVEESKAKGTPMPSNDLYALLRDNRANDEVLSRFWDDSHTVPDWVDWEQLARGQKFFYRYILANVFGFAVQGFMAENSAVPGVIEVLVRTGGFSTRTLLGRLLETFQWLIQVTHDVESIKPGGEAHASTLRVRLLHSSVRHRILNLVQSKPSYFNTSKYGIPVNTLDSIHSISTFSCNHMWLQLPKFGIRPSATEIDDYIALFRYLAHVIGTPTEYFVDSDTAKRTMESMLVHELRTTETSRVVAYNFLQCVGNLPSPFHVSMGFLRVGSRWANGDEMCDELDIGGAGILDYMVLFGFCSLVTVMAWLQWLIPGLDERFVAFSRKHLYDGIVNRKSKTLFEFKYVPQMGKSIGKERHESAGSGKQDSMRNLPILPSVATLMDMGHFEMFCLVAGTMIWTMAIYGVLLMGRWVLEAPPTFFASHTSVSGLV